MTDKKINNENLEKALSKKEKIVPEMPKEVEIGFHQGSINTLLNERTGLINMISQIEKIIQAHIKRLEELGIKVRTNPEKKE
jgi:argininosuccinate synthase